MIPKILHLMWFQGMSSAPQDLHDNMSLWKEHNPGWTIKEWDREKLIDLIDQEFPAWLDYFMVIPGSTPLASIIKKCDLARLFIMHSLGGVYADLDLQCRGSLDEFLSNPWIYNKSLKHVRKLPVHPSQDPCDKGAYEAILSRENCFIDSVGRGVANGILIGKPGAPFWMEFAHNQREAVNGNVLDFVGTWSLTRYIRAKVDGLKGRIACIPPHYFLWEPDFFQCEPPFYCVTVHPAKNSWGDHTQKHWWMV